MVRPSKDIEMELSESKMEKSLGAFDKRPRMYANLATSKNKGDLSRESEVDMKSSSEHYSKSEAYRMNPY